MNSTGFNMTKEELYEKLDIDSPEDFSYFEQFADLIETEEKVEEGLVKEVLSAVSSQDAGDLVQNYFDDFTESLPDDADDLISLIDSIKQNLLMCTEDLDIPANRKTFAELICSFREWLHKKGNAKIDGQSTSIFCAAAEHRAEKIGHGSHTYDFSMSCDFDMEDISINLGEYKQVDILADEYDTDTEQ